jgi:hypothetical protein
MWKKDILLVLFLQEGQSWLLVLVVHACDASTQEG